MTEQENEHIREQLGMRIKRYRMEQGLSLRKFALMIGMDYSYICNIESGKANATVDALVKISNGLGVTIKELF